MCPRIVDCLFLPKLDSSALRKQTNRFTRHAASRWNTCDASGSDLQYVFLFAKEMFVGAHGVCGSDEWAWLCALPGHEEQCERPEGRRRDPFCDVITEYLRHLVRKAASTAGCAADTTTAFCVVCTLEVPSGARTCPHCFSVSEAFADIAGIVSKCAVKWAAVTTCPCALLLLFAFTGALRKAPPASYVLVWGGHPDDGAAVEEAACNLAPTAVQVLARKRLRAQGRHLARAGDHCQESVDFTIECVRLLDTFRDHVQQRCDSGKSIYRAVRFYQSCRGARFVQKVSWAACVHACQHGSATLVGPAFPTPFGPVSCARREGHVHCPKLVQSTLYCKLGCDSPARHVRQSCPPHARHSFVCTRLFCSELTRCVGFLLS
jgi:hypothetical protein